MSQTVAVVRSTLPTTASGTVDLTKTSFGTPSAAIVFFCQANTTNNPAAIGIISVGFWDGTNQRGVGIAVSDSVSPTLDYKDGSTTAIPQGNPPGSVRYYAISAVTDGIRLTYSSGSGTPPARYVTAILLSGISASAGSITPNASIGGTQASGSLGFAPKMVFFATVGSSSFGEDGPVDASLSFGVAESAGSTNRVVALGDVNGASTTASSAFYSESYAMCELTTGLSWAADVTTFGADTFTITTRNAAGGDVVAFLALGGASLSAAVGALTTRTSTGHGVTTTTVTPNALLTALTTASTLGTVQTSGTAGLDFGLADSNGQFSHNISIADNVGTSHTHCAAQAAEIIDLNAEDGSGGTTALCDAAVTLDSSDFDLNYTTVDATARKGFYVAFGPAVSSGTLKTWNGLARASAKTVNGLAIGSVKTYDTLTP